MDESVLQTLFREEKRFPNKNDPLVEGQYLILRECVSDARLPSLP